MVGLADSVIIAKRLGVEKLSMMRRYFEGYRFPTIGIWHKVMQLLLEQCNSTPKDDSPLHQMFLYLQNIPLPYQLQMASLWDECTNWRLLQASAHQDIQVQLIVGDVTEEHLFLMEPLSINVFEYCRRLAHTNIIGFRFLGVSMETVRTFLGEWVLSEPDVVDWEPSIPTNSFNFSSSFRITSGARNRIIWECQRRLLSELAKKPTARTNMSSSAELIMLFILSMPVLCVGEVLVEEENGNVNNEAVVLSDGENSDTTLSGADSSLNLSVMGYRVYSPLAPQDISIFVICNTETRRSSLSLQHNGADGLFKWEDWVNASMGCMKGLYERMNEFGNVETIESAFRRVDLRKPMLELSPLSWLRRSQFDSGNEDRLVETGTVRVWTGWPAFDVRICKFEVDQWLRACNIDIDNIEQYWNSDKEIGRAEKTIRKIRKVIHLNKDDERSEE